MENFRKERSHYAAARRRMRLHGLEDSGFEAGDFDFDVEECACLVAGEDLLEGRKIEELGGRSLGDGKALKLWIVADEGALVGALSDVEFEAVAAVLEGKVEGRQGIFRNGSSGAGSTMTEQQGSGH